LAGLGGRADGVRGGADVGGGGAAAAADQGHPGRGEQAEVAGHVVAVDAELEAARAGAARLARVRLGGHRDRRVPHQVLGHGEHPLRADGAVGAEHRHRQAGQHGGDLARRLAAQGVRVVGEGGLGDDRRVADLAGRRHRLDQLVQVAERLQDDQVDAGQRAELLPEHLRAFGRADAAALPCGDRGRDRAGHQDLAVALGLRGAGDPDAGPVDLVHLVGEALVAEPEPVRAERVGLDDVRAGCEVALVDGRDQAGVGQVELGQRAVKRGAGRVQHGAHRAVADDDPPAEQAGQSAHGSSPSASRISRATCAISRSV
jgi:hypothetical protein